MQEYVIVVDRGSTNTKAVAFNKAGDEICAASISSQKLVTVSPGWVEQDLEGVWQDVVIVIKELLSTVKSQEVLGIFITGQGNGLIALDAQGSLVSRGIHSLDRRAADLVSQWKSSGLYEKVAGELGMAPASGAPIPLLAWLKKNDRQSFDRIHRILFTKDWINFKLCGKIATDPTDASGAGLMNIHKNTYAHGVFRELGISEIENKLPEIKPSHEVLGYVTKPAAERTGLLEGTPVLVGCHDIAAFPFGIGTVDTSQLVCAMGTWGLNLMPTKNVEGLPFVFAHTYPGYYLTGTADGNSGSVLDIMLSRIYEKEAKEIYGEVEACIINREPSSILFQPYLFESMFSHYSSAGFYGIRKEHTKEDIIYSVYEGIVMGHWMNITVIPGYEKIKGIWLIGGGSKSKLFGRLFADISGMAVKVPDMDEVAARGGALNALVGLGVYRDHAEASIPVNVKVEYQPDLSRHEFYKKKFRIFRELTQSNLSLWEKISELE